MNKTHIEIPKESIAEKIMHAIIWGKELPSRPIRTKPGILEGSIEDEENDF